MNRAGSRAEVMQTGGIRQKVARNSSVSKKPDQMSRIDWSPYGLICDRNNQPKPDIRAAY